MDLGIELKRSEWQYVTGKGGSVNVAVLAGVNVGAQAGAGVSGSIGGIF